MPWVGFVSSVVEGLQDLITKNKQALGLNDVFVGERRKGWQDPVCFIYLGPQGVRGVKASGRNDVDEWSIPIRIVVAKKAPDGQIDVKVIRVLEAICDLLDANRGVGGTTRLVFDTPIAIAPDLVDDGLWMTVGSIDLTYWKDNLGRRAALGG